MLLNGLDHSLILVAAPAGFGKITLLSAWLETCDLSHALLQHPPQGMRLVIASRLEPQVSLDMLRERHQVAEIRGHDLRFSLAEIAAFVERTLGAPPDGLPLSRE